MIKLEKTAPTEMKLFSKNKKTASVDPWVTKQIEQLVAEKHRYLDEYKLRQRTDLFVSFEKYCNLVTKKLKEAQNQPSEDF